MHNTSAHELPQYYQQQLLRFHCLNLFGHVTYMLQSSTYQTVSLTIIIVILLWEFFPPALADGFLWSLSDSKSPQVSRALLSILTDLKML